MTAVKRCPRCGRVKPADQFYWRRRTRLSSYCRSCQRAAAHLAMYDQFSAYTTVLEREGARNAGDVAIIGDEAHVEREILRLRDAGATEFIGNAWGFTTAEEHDRTVAVLGALSGRS